MENDKQGERQEDWRKASEDTVFHFQIFQQVTTQISSSIVSELQKRGDLEECLQAVGRACKVAWQRSGAAVTMTCDLDELCHAQNCLKQVN